MKNTYSFSENLYKFLDEGKMCDVTLVAGDGTKIPAHRLILSTATDFFYTMFTTTLQDQTRTEINIADIDGATLINVVKCFYTGEIEINEENVEPLLAAASFLLFPYLEGKCTEFLGQPGVLDESNCLRIWASARNYQFEDLVKLAVAYVLRHFPEVVQCDSFKQLNISDLMEFMENDALAVDSEEEVFNTIVDWVEFDLNKRRAQFPNLVQCVRLHLLPSNFIIDRVLSVCQSFDCVDAFTALGKTNNSDKQKRTKLATFDGDLLAINYFLSARVIESFSHQSKQWTRLENVTIGYTDFGAELVDERLIIIGGCQDRQVVDLVLSIDVTSNIVKYLKPMLKAKSGHSTIKLDGFIYAIGGYSNDLDPMDQRYDIKTNTWVELPRRAVERSRPALALFMKKIFVMGGSGSSISVQCYDPLTNKWSYVASMNKIRYGAQACVSGGYLYIVGGCDTRNNLASIERYDYQTDTWTVIMFRLKTARKDFGMTVLQDWIILVGGCTGSNNYESCEKLNLRTGEIGNFPSMLDGKNCCLLLCKN